MTTRDEAGAAKAETDRELARFEFVERYIRELKWSADASEHEIALVAGNLRSFWYEAVKEQDRAVAAAIEAYELQRVEALVLRIRAHLVALERAGVPVSVARLDSLLRESGVDPEAPPRSSS